MVEVFKTNVAERNQATMLEGVLLRHFTLRRVNFDLEDCDKVLRVEGEDLLPLKVMEVLRSNGYNCLPLE